MTKKSMHLLCGTLSIISATFMTMAWGGSLQVAGLLITGLAMLAASVEPPTPRRGADYGHDL